MNIVDFEEDDVAEKVALINNAASVDDLSDAYGNLMYVDMKIGDKSVVTMVDTGATHTFVASRIVKEYGLKVTSCATRMKAVNSAAQQAMAWRWMFHCS